MKKAIDSIVTFVSENWLVLFLVLTIVAVTMLVIITVACVRTIRESTTIPNMKAKAENDYYLESRFAKDEEVADEQSESSDSFTDLFD